MSTYSIGDWVVHANYGVGEVRSVETRTISGDEADYYKIKTTDDLFVWVPVDEDDDQEYLRDLTTPRRIQEVLEVLRNDPKELPRKSYGRQTRISKAKGNHSIIEKARLVRDLWVHRQEKRLGMKERRALQWATQHLVAEWSLTVDESPEEVEQKMYQVLRKTHLA